MSEFIKIIESISYRHSVNNVFDDFLFMSVCAFSMGRMEKQYLQTIEKYTKEEVNLFSNALRALISEYSKTVDGAGHWNDLLGEYFMQINSKSSASSNGQFFTPVPVCDMMAKTTCRKEVAKEQITVCDPTCGSSRSLIAHSRLHANNRLSTFYYGMDLDARCVNMSVLNYVMFGMKGVVIHMDSLAMKVYSGYRIYLPETGLFVAPINSKQCAEFILEKSDDDNELKKIAEIMLSEKMNKQETKLWKEVI